MIEFLLSLFFSVAQAADLNGYTATYEQAFSIPGSCTSTVTAADSEATIESTLNGVTAGDRICADAGDYTGIGEINITANCTSASPCYFTLSGSATTHPYDLAVGNRARFNRISNTGNYWVIYRLTIDLGSASGAALKLNGSDNNIVDSVDVDGNDVDSLLVRIYGGANNTTIQNSIIHNTGKAINTDRSCLNISGADNYVVNNEIFDCGGDGIVFDTASNPHRFVVENNDIYQTSAYLINCDGTAGTGCNCGEDGIDVKSNNPTTGYSRIIHNRIWGWRTTYETCSGTGSYGYGINDGGGETRKQLLIQHNIISEVANGVDIGAGPVSKWSFVGNIMYDINYAGSPTDVPSNGDGTNSVAIRWNASDNIDAYLNSIINADIGFKISTSATTNDMRCNVFVNIATLRYDANSWGTSSQADYNAFVDTDATYTVGGVPTNIDKSSATNWVASTAYSAGDYVKPVTPVSWYYKAIVGGTSGGSAPTWPSRIGSYVKDGTVVWKAVLGPYTYYRKLITGATLKTIPFATPGVSADFTSWCPINGESNATGSRTGIGIDNTQFGDGGWMDTDIDGDSY